MVNGIPGTKYVAWNSGKGKFQVKYKHRILGSGRTLIEALMMRDWCKAHGWVKFAGGLRYIHQRSNGTFCIRKNNVHHGTFRSLEEAMFERDCLVSVGWDYDLLVELE